MFLESSHVRCRGGLAVAVAGTRRWRDVTWVALAAIGVALLGLDGDQVRELIIGKRGVPRARL